MNHFFAKEWREGNFLIPVNKTYRRELLALMREALVSAQGADRSNAEAVKALKQRIAAVDAYEQA